MIEAARRLEDGVDVRSREQSADSRRELRRAGRGIAERVELAREAAEIVNRVRMFAARYLDGVRIVMRRQHDDRRRSRQVRSELAQEPARRAVDDREQRRPVRKD